MESAKNSNKMLLNTLNLSIKETLNSLTRERSTIRNLRQAITFCNSYLSSAYRNLCADFLSIRPYSFAYRYFALCKVEFVNRDSSSVWSDRWHRIRCYRTHTSWLVISMLRWSLRPTISPTQRPVLDSYLIPLRRTVRSHCLSVDWRSVESSLRFANYWIFRRRAEECQCLAIDLHPNQSSRRVFVATLVHLERP